MGWRCLVVTVLLLGVWVGCAVQTQGRGISERDIDDEEHTPVQATPRAEDGQPSSLEQEDLNDYLNQQEQNRHRRPNASPTPPVRNRDHVPEPHTPDPRNPTPRPPVPTPTPVPPSVSQPSRPALANLPLQPPLPAPDNSRWQTASGLAKNAQKKAALALVREGQDLLRQKKFDLAERRFEKAISLDPSCGYAYLGLAERRFAQGRWAEAADLASTATLRLRGDGYFLSRAHLLAARALVNNHQASAAYGQVQSALVADPNNREAAALARQLESYLGPAIP